MTGTPRRILVLDEDAAFREFMQDLLTDEGHRVATAASVAEARALLRHWQADVLVTDSTVWAAAPAALPALLAADPTFSGIPTLICTVSPAAGLPAPSRSLEVLGKPFQIEALLAALDRLIARHTDANRNGGGAD